MRSYSKQLEPHRIQHPPFTSMPGLMSGAFQIDNLFVISSGRAPQNGTDWEHVSVSLRDRVPTWEEMCRIKVFFWKPEEVVMQLHPAESEYIDDCVTCLHLWRPARTTIPTPPRHLVGLGISTA